LLQHGVNVDHVASYRGSAYIELDYTGTALLSHVNDDEAEGDELKDILTCRKLLIEAGCDPTIPIFDNEGREEGTAFSSAFEFGVPVRRIDTHQIKTTNSF
jgi:hypothetical protein